MKFVFAIIFAILLSLGILGRVVQARERRHRKPVAPDWAGISGYTELSAAASEAYWLTPDEFLEGPFGRFLEMAGNSDEPVRARARIMEFCTGSFRRYSDSLAKRGGDTAELEARARAMMAERFAHLDGEDRDYMIEVFDGVSNHNWRGKRGE